MIFGLQSRLSTYLCMPFPNTRPSLSRSLCLYVPVSLLKHFRLALSCIIRYFEARKLHHRRCKYLWGWRMCQIFSSISMDTDYVFQRYPR